MAKKLTTKQIEIRASIVSDTKKSLATRKKAHYEVMQAVLNPKSAQEFDPETFDPFEGDPDLPVKRRLRKEPTRRLPTLGMKPKEILEGQMVGMFESKQDLYLMIAWLSERVSNLEDSLKGEKRSK